MPERFHLFRDYTAELGTKADPGPDLLICIDPSTDPISSDGSIAWPFPLVYSAVMLFEALPQAFTFDELAGEGSRQGLSAARSVEHLRTWEDLGMIETTTQGFSKTGRKPYF